MKHYHKITTLLAIAIISLANYAQTPAQPHPTTKKEVSNSHIRLRAEKVNVTKRPQAPSRQIIECDYNDGYLAFDFAISEGECEVLLTEYITEAEQSYIIDSSDCYAEIYVGVLYESTVTLTTESGAVYTCELTSE